MELKTRFLVFKILFKQNIRVFSRRLTWREKGLPKWERVSLIGFPEFYLVTTIHTEKDSGGIYSENVTKINKNSDPKDLEEAVLKHLNDSIWHIKNPFNLKDSPTLGSGFPFYLFRRGGSELPFPAVPGEAKYPYGLPPLDLFYKYNLL